MAKISEHNSYNIEDLVTAWESGWNHLEKYANFQYQQKLEGSGDKAKSPLQRIHLAVTDVLSYYRVGKYLNVPQTLPDDAVILNLAASSNRTVYKPVKHTSFLGGYPLGSWAKDNVKLHKSLQKVTNAFAISDDYEQAFSKIATKKNLELFKEYWSQQDCRYCSWANSECLSVKIEPRLKKMMHHLECGLSSKKKCQEAWWNCLWLFMEPAIKTMLEIRKQINADTPLYHEQIRTLDYYMSFGYPTTDSFMENEDKRKLQIILKPRTPRLFSPFEIMSVILLVQPAFDLAQQLQNTFSKSRFIKQCHAPSCGKLFYTQDKRQLVCVGSRGNKRTRCALEWQQYRNWLKNLGKSPEKNWNNPKRMGEFLSRNH